MRFRTILKYNHDGKGCETCGFRRIKREGFDCYTPGKTCRNGTYRNYVFVHQLYGLLDEWEYKTVRQQHNKTQQNKENKGGTMETLTEKLKAAMVSTVNTNKAALKVNAQMTAGESVSQVLMGTLEAKLPPALAVFLKKDGTLANGLLRAAATSLVAVAIGTATDNPKVKYVTDGMVLKATTDTVASLGIADLIQDITKNITGLATQTTDLAPTDKA